jgi:hypothetical protein
MKRIVTSLLTVLFWVPSLFSQESPTSQPAPARPSRDALVEIFDQLAISQSDMGYRPKGYWTRYPDPKDIPFKMLAFDDLLAEPQRIYDFVRIMALAVEDYLHPDYLASADRGSSKGLLKTVYYCGVRNATAEMRDYSASLWAELNPDEPLLWAIRSIYERTGRVYRFNSMGEPSDFPLTEHDLREVIKPLDPEVQRLLAKTVIHLTDAYKFREVAMRNVDYHKAQACWRLRGLGDTQTDALEYFPQLEDCARDLDINSIYYAGYKLLESSEMLSDSLIALKSDPKRRIDWSRQRLNVVTPIGRIVLGGNGRDTHNYSDALLIVDVGGDDTYLGAVGSTPSLDIPISLAVDLEGNDTYINDDEFLPSQGAAIFGAGVLLDMEGDDVYKSKCLSQGAAMLGLGVIADMDGDDRYEMATTGQGAAYFGVGVAIDNTGDDEYRLLGDGQGFGGMGGVGTLVNRTGNDHYWAAPTKSEIYRPDRFHAADSANSTNAQGCGMGRRGDVSDGHSWAGGMGTLIDLAGNDLYESDNWSTACGYWYGMGFLWDGGGDDIYRSANWSQVCGAHFCIAALIDEGGNDQHILTGEYSDGIGFGHDYTVALLLDRGGNDIYRCPGDGLGFAVNMSQVYVVDTDGDDRYITTGRKHNFGINDFTSNNPPPVGVYQLIFANQISIFADVNGRDEYLMEEYGTGKELGADPRMADGVTRFYPTPEERATLANPRFYGCGRDFSDWSGPAIEIFRDKMKKRFEVFK